MGVAATCVAEVSVVLQQKNYTTSSVHDSVPRVPLHARGETHALLATFGRTLVELFAYAGQAFEDVRREGLRVHARLDAAQVRGEFLTLALVGLLHLLHLGVGHLFRDGGRKVAESDVVGRAGGVHGLATRRTRRHLGGGRVV